MSLELCIVFSTNIRDITFLIYTAHLIVYISDEPDVIFLTSADADVYADTNILTSADADADI